MNQNQPTHSSIERAKQFGQLGQTYLPGYLGIEVAELSLDQVILRLPVQPHLLAPNGFLHAGAVVTLADTACGYGCVIHLPEGANFTTIELKSNHLSTVREGMIVCHAKPIHTGKSTHVWDASVYQELHGELGKTLALFRCTQMVLLNK